MSESTGNPERWAQVLGYEGYYEVSDLGRVRSLDRRIERRDGVVLFRAGRVLRGSPRRDNRLHVALRVDATPTYRLISTVVLEAFVCPRPDGMYACHNNGDSMDDRLANLRWDTPTSNNYDRVAHGRHFQCDKTHCPRGHLLTEPNLVPHRLAMGRRNCRACGHAFSAAGRAKRAGRPFDLDAAADAFYTRLMPERSPVR